MAATLILGVLLSGTFVGYSSPGPGSANQQNLYHKLGRLAGRVGLTLPASLAGWQAGSITMTSTVSSCYYTSGQSRKTVSVEVAWSGLTNPVTTITVSLPGAIGSTTRTISAQTTGNPPIVSPQVVAFEIPSTFTGNMTVSDSANSVNGNTITITETGSCAPLVCASTDIGGTVYSDYNGDGTRNAGDNPGVGGVAVTGYDNTGMSYTTTSNSEGKYCLSVPSANYPVRVEFSSLPRSSGRDGTNSASSVQFVSAPAQSVDLSISTPDGYCEDNPWVMTPCYVFGDPLRSAAPTNLDDVVGLIRTRYNNDGIKIGVQPIADVDEIGATWGLAYRKQSDHLFVAATLRRHSGSGPEGLGGIYVLKAQATSNTINRSGNVVDQWSVVGQLGVAVAAGTPFTGNGLDSNAARLLPTNRTDPSHDVAAFAAIGKVGLGDIDLTVDGNTLFFVNYHDKRLYSVDISGYNLTNQTTASTTRPTSANLSFKNTEISGICTGGAWRPSALKVTKDFAYVGGVCDGSGGSRSDMRAKVLRVSLTGGSNWGSNAWTTILDFPLTYPKGYPAWQLRNNTGANSTNMWRIWSDVFSDLQSAGGQIGNAVPILSDIEFDVDGSMILGFNDRAGMQTGNQNYSTDSNSTTLYTGNVGGDILRAVSTGSSYLLENAGKIGPLTGFSTTNNEGPGFGEFYTDNFTCCLSFDPHTETILGGLAVLPGKGEVVATSMDPRSTTSPPSGSAPTNAAGLRYLSNLTGQQNRSNVIYSGSNLPGSEVGKSTGLGDVELSCGVINYLEIGNRIWNDADGDGVQDPGEAGIPGVAVTLFQNGVQVGSPVTTDSQGRYLFNTGLLPNTAYEIRVSRSGMQSLGYPTLTFADSGLGVTVDADLRDSDAILSGSNAIIPVTTGNYGEVNHTLDMGWRTAATQTYSLGNRVWKDLNNSGSIDLADGSTPGVNGVVVRLLSAGTLNQATDSNGALVADQTTSGGGYYRFDSLPAGNYVVEVLSSNFATGGPLAGCDSSLIDESDPNGDVDSNDNGLGTMPSSTTGVRSGVVALGNGTGGTNEPTGDSDPLPNPGTGEAPNDRSNRTVDFGFCTSSGSAYSLGNRVWKDLNNSGTIDSADGLTPGVDGVVVRLLSAGTLSQATDSNGALVADQTTSGGGYYRFDNLPIGSYVVEVRSSNFATGGPLAGCDSSLIDESDPNSDVDSNDNGIGTMPSATTGVRSGVVALGNGTGGTNEPTNDNDPTTNPGTGEAPNNRSNRTVDFGFAPPSFVLGDRIWLDGDLDGIQDPGEVGIDGVALNLYKNGTLVGQTTTSGGGIYQFNSSNVTLNGAAGLLPNMAYQISIATNTGLIGGMFLSPPNTDPSVNGDLADSDAVAVGTTAVINLTTGPTPQSNFSYDIGFGVMRVTLEDPAVCLSPGRIVEIVVELGNPSSAVSPDGTGPELQIDLPAGISRIVSATTQSGSSGPGVVTVTGVSQILWNGALNPGDKVTLTYLVQLGSVLSGTQICPRSTAAYDSNLDGTKDSTAIIDVCMTVNCPGSGAGNPVPIDSDPSDLIPGSLLIFNIYTSTVNNARQDTRFSLTNTNPVSSTYVHLFFIDGQTCSAADRFINLSPSQTTSFLASDIDPLTTGFMIAIATDENGCPTSFNHLIGSEHVKFESGHRANLGATAITAPGKIACNTASASATLNFDGLSYSRVPRALAIDSLSSLADGNQTMLIVNRLGGDLSNASVSSARFFGLLFDDAEKSSSFNLNTSGCQMRGMISSNFPRSIPRYDQVIPAGRTGWLKLWTEIDQGLSGSMINYNGSNLFHQGHNLHSLSMTSSVTYTVPVYPPQ